MPLTRRLNCEVLEGRDVPAQFGIPWVDGNSITVSFAPDGTNVDGKSSKLFSTLQGDGLSTAVWQKEILRAFQSWAAVADLNIGLVSDNGAALGESGNSQGDTRFGDIRIFAVPLSSSVLAITTPSGDLGGTRTGDIILNSNYNFNVGSARDLFTVFLQESGHSLGIGNSPNTSSAMYEFYQGVRTGLSAEDVGSVQSLYGDRPRRTYEQAGGNDTSSAATALAGTTAMITYGDVASDADMDWYKFIAPTSGNAELKLRSNGLSLLSGQVVVFDSNLNQITIAGSNTYGTDLTVNLSSLTPGARYFLRVSEAPSTPFDAGQYELSINAASGTPTLTLGGQTAVDDNGTNNSWLTGTTLANNGDYNYSTFARLRSGDTDFYRVRTPLVGMNQANVLTASVRAFGDIAPKIQVLNSLGLPVNATVAADGNGYYTVIVPQVAGNVSYSVVISSRNGGAADYELDVGFRSTVTTPHQVASGLLTILNPTTSGSIQVTGSAMLYFRLSSALTPIIGPSVVLTVLDSNNNTVFRLLARAGDQVDGVALLNSGRYKVVISANGTILPSLLSLYSLEMALLTDPVGVRPSDPNQAGSSSGTTKPTSTTPVGYNYYNDRGYYVWGEKAPSGNG